MATGALQVYSYEAATTADQADRPRGVPVVKLLKSHNLSRRSIDQIGVLAETNQLVVLAGERRKSRDHLALHG